MPFLYFNIRCCGVEVEVLTRIPVTKPTLDKVSGGAVYMAFAVECAGDGEG
jgi:hypothetical protein